MPNAAILTNSESSSTRGIPNCLRSRMWLPWSFVQQDARYLTRGGSEVIGGIGFGESTRESNEKS
jgi:hypothetical protein